VKAVVLYDSVFGNTEKIAKAIGEALGSAEEVTFLRPGSGQLAGLTLLVVGSPTRGFKPTEELVNELKSMQPNALKGTRSAAFDTRFTEAKIKASAFFLPWLVKRYGYAADTIGKLLKEKGAELVAPAQGFFVDDTEGPLLEGELERAGEWARGLREKA
jgi:flavodoxin